MVASGRRKGSVPSSKDWRPFIYGGMASIAAEFGTFPIDTTKTRLQIQGQHMDSMHSALRYRGMCDCFLKITREEGMRSLYSGIWPAVLRQATYGTIKFGTYYTLKKLANDYGILVVDKSTGEERISVNILCAVTAGAVSSAIANPTDVLKVRMQVNGAGVAKGAVRGTDKNLFRAFYEIYQYEGVRGLWRGVGPTAQRAVVIAGVELPVYDFCKNHLMDTFGDRVSNHFISSFIASLGSAIASTPLDVIRTRLMNQKRVLVASINNGCAATTTAATTASTAKLYEGTIHCALQTIRTEGFMALYKGFIPAWLRMGPWNIIFFITYEQLKVFY